MPEFPGRVRMPRLPSAPGSPVPGEMYYDTGTSTLYWWDGTVWKSASGGGGTAEVNISTGGPSPRLGELLWVDTDDISPVGVTKVMRTGHTWAVGGALTAGQAIPPFFIPEASGQSAVILGARTKILSGTSIVAQLTRNAANIGTAITVASSAATTIFGSAVAITDGDEIGVVLSSPTGTPTALSMTVIVEHTV